MKNDPVKCCECEKPTLDHTNTSKCAYCGLHFRPVSQTVDGREKEFDELTWILDEEDKVCLKRLFLNTLSTLVKEMEGLKKDITENENMTIEENETVAHYQVGLNAGISVAVEVVKKMGV